MTVTAAKLAQAGLSGPYSLPHSRRTPSFGNKIRMSRKMVRNLFPNDQFGNNTFHLQIGRRNKTGLIYQIWEQCVPFNNSNSEQNSPGCLIVKQTVPLTNRKSEQNTRKFRDKWPTSLRTSCSIQRCIFETKQSQIINLGTMCSVYR